MMLNTLRRRFILSHVLPVLVVIPLMGIALIYMLESRVLLPSLSHELTGQAALVSELACQESRACSDPTQVQAFVSRIGPRLDSRLMMLDLEGRLLASTDPTDANRLGQPVDHPSLSAVQSGQVFVQENYSQDLQGQIVDVWMPVVHTDGQVVSVVRMSYNLTNVFDRFLFLRYLVIGVLAAGILLGGTVGWILALNLVLPLRQVSQAIDQLARGERPTSLPEQKLEEINLLVHAFNTLVERLRSLEEARRHLLANLVHELARPLGAVRSAFQALQGGADRDAALREELLSGIEQELQRLQRLLDDLAHLHDQVLGLLEMDRRSVALGEWLPQVLIPWRESAQSKGLRWQTNLAPNLPIWLIDPDRLAQALGNLLSNAIKYTPPGGTVLVEAAVDNESFWIRVSDTGPGITPEEQVHVFEPFYRGQMFRRFPQGMGLGLTIAHDLVTAHGGRLELDSVSGLGSHFTIRIPDSSNKT